MLKSMSKAEGRISVHAMLHFLPGHDIKDHSSIGPGIGDRAVGNGYTIRHKPRHGPVLPMPLRAVRWASLSRRLFAR